MVDHSFHHVTLQEHTPCILRFDFQKHVKPRVIEFFQMILAPLPQQFGEDTLQIAYRLLDNGKVMFSLGPWRCEARSDPSLEDVHFALQWAFEKTRRTTNCIHELEQHIILGTKFNSEEIVEQLYSNPSPSSYSLSGILKRAANLKDIITTFDVISPNAVVAFIMTVHEIAHGFPESWMRFNKKYINCLTFDNLETFSIYFELKAIQHVINNPQLFADCFEGEDLVKKVALIKEIATAEMTRHYKLAIHQYGMIHTLCVVFSQNDSLQVTEDFIESFKTNMERFIESQSDINLKKLTINTKEDLLTSIIVRDRTVSIENIAYLALDEHFFGLLRTAPLVNQNLPLTEVFNILGDTNFNLVETLFSYPDLMRFLVSIIRNAKFSTS
jgi:hypothetical protein